MSDLIGRFRMTLKCAECGAINPAVIHSEVHSTSRFERPPVPKGVIPHPEVEEQWIESYDDPIEVKTLPCPECGSTTFRVSLTPQLD